MFFRAFVLRKSAELGLTGYVRNLPGGKALEVLAEGRRSRLEQLLGYLRVGPPAARVERVETTWSEYSGGYESFDVRY